MAERRKIPSPSLQQEAAKKQRAGQKALREGKGRQESRRLKRQGKAIQQQQTERERAQARAKVTGPTSAKDLAGARTKKAGSSELEKLQQKLDAARKSGKSMLASQLRKRIAAVKRGMAQ